MGNPVIVTPRRSIRSLGRVSFATLWPKQRAMFATFGRAGFVMRRGRCSCGHKNLKVLYNYFRLSPRSFQPNKAHALPDHLISSAARVWCYLADHGGEKRLAR